MNQNLRKISEFLQRNESLSAEEKASLSKAVADADKELEITAFKLDRTEKVKRTTAILLEETIEELEQKRKSVEAQNRELEIEASLERVRAIALSMQNPAEMVEVCRIISEQLEFLKVKDIRNVQTAVIDESKGTYVNYEYYARHDKLLITEVSYKTHHLQEEFAMQMLKGAGEFFSSSLIGQEVKDWYEYQKTTNQFADSFLEGAQTLNYYMFSLGPVALGISTYSPLIEEEINLFKRFRNVFELAYRRFLDIQKAESQAREAQIQLALERVRARTMAMQKSEELSETAFILFQQFKELGEIPIQITIGIIHESEKSIEFSITGGNGTGTQINRAFNASIEEPALMQKLFKAWKAQARSVVIKLAGKELEGWINYRNTISGTKDNTDYSGAIRVISAGLFSKGLISISTHTPLPDETIRLLEKFAGVFEQTYTRFLDLQKAESQARESQIQLALERVRARTMAMQRSDEMAETAAILFEQFIALGEMPERMAIEIVNEAEHVFEIWATEHGGKQFNSLIKTSLDEPYVMQKMYRAWKEQNKSITIDLQGIELEEYFQYLKQMKLPVDRKIFGKRRVQNVATFSKGILTIITPEPRPRETIDILERFAGVFDGTYTRFLDLQRAEAQAREAQIEAALERVRSKTMAMHNSQDVGDTVATMFDELVKLGIVTNRCGILIFSESIHYTEVWTAKSNPEGKAILITGHLDMATHPLLEGAFRDWKNKKPVHVYPMLGIDLRNYYQTINDSKYYPTLFDMESLPAKEFHCDFYFAEGCIFAFTAELIPDEATLIFKRFAGVFGQTYRRYLDLLKAEAQARESQIEAALERVRSRTMAMQKSDELAETSAVLFQQLILLGIEPNRLYIAILKDDQANAEFWITDEDGSKVSSAFETNLNKNTVFSKMLVGWKKKKNSTTIDLKGEELQEYFRYLSSLHVPFKGGLSQTRRIQYIGYFNKGFIGMASPDDQPEETIKLLERFSAVFNLTFTRFNDLKIAEAHAEQAEIDLFKLKEEKKRTEEALTELKEAQKQLIQSEKMASLGELTAGIAHEIQNPLNFVNNFSEVSTELVDEMNEEIDKGNIGLAREIARDLRQNLEKINHHGKRAGDIVKGMLQHSRNSSGVKEPTNINALADEYLRLAYHGLRAKDKSFNATMKTDFDESIGNINIIPQDIGRVILNLITNAFYVVNEKKRNGPLTPEGGIENTQNEYEPTVTVSTKLIVPPKGGQWGAVLISVADNGNGIPKGVVDKIFQPFFTTKPTGEGTGLGLSLSYDIIKAHGGELKVETKEGEGSSFIIQIPCN